MLFALNKQTAVAISLLSLTENLQAQNIGRELVFSADLCYNGISEKASSQREPQDALNFRGMGIALCLCNTKAKLAIKEVSNDFTNFKWFIK